MLVAGSVHIRKLLAPASGAVVAWVSGVSAMTMLGRSGAAEVLGSGATFAGLSALCVALCVGLRVRRVTALVLTCVGAAAIPFVATFVASPVLRPVIVLPEAGWILGATFGGFLVLPVALGRELARSRSFGGAPLALGVLGAWMAAAALLCLAALGLAHLAGGGVVGGAPIAATSAVAAALAGLAAATVGARRLVLQRRWLARVRRGEDDEWAVEAVSSAGEPVGAGPLAHGAEGAEDVLVRRSRVHGGGAYRAGERRDPAAFVGRGGADLHHLGSGTNFVVALAAGALAVHWHGAMVHRAEEAHSRYALSSMVRAASAYYHTEPPSAPHFPPPPWRFPSSAPATPSVTSCGASQDGDSRVDRPQFGGPTWRELGIGPGGPDPTGRIQYEVISEGEGPRAVFTALALADLACNGVATTFEGRIAVDGDGRLRYAVERRHRQ